MLLAAFTLESLRNPLVLFGFAGQAVFMGRFVLQWYVSERQGRSTVPVAFWYMSLAGGLMLGLYAFLNADPVFTAGQLLGIAIYIRNLVLIHGRQTRVRRIRRDRRRSAPDDAPPSAN